MHPADQWIIPLIVGAVLAIVGGIITWEVLHYLRTRPAPPTPT